MNWSKTLGVYFAAYGLKFSLSKLRDLSKSKSEAYYSGIESMLENLKAGETMVVYLPNKTIKIILKK